MSKGNVLLGMARGAVGDIVFSRLKGQQVTRARNRQPANPRTSSQMYQRALFTDAVKFYTRGRQKLYQFAFESKKANESDYNAFMRENAKRGVVISKAAFDNYNYPAIGNWIIAKGSLTPIDWQFTDKPYVNMGLHADSEALPTTLGELSTALVNGDTILNGDIITFVSIAVDKTNIPNVAGTSDNVPEWTIRQLQLDTTSTQPLSDYNIAVTKSGQGSTIVWQLAPTDSVPSTANYMLTGAVVLSRNTATGVKVATTELNTDNVDLQVALDAARERSYIDAVVESWRITQQAPVVSEAVMQGSIAQSIAVDFEPAGE